MINGIKNDFESEIAANDKRLLKLNKVKGELFALTTQTSLFEKTKNEKTIWNKQVKELTDTMSQLETELEEIRSSKIYENAFEWRFEFPEVLNDDGEFIGFDVIIGNPPYKMIQPNNTSVQEISLMKNKFPFADFKIDLFHLFFQLGGLLGKEDSYLSFIAPSTLLNNVFAENLRTYIDKNNRILKIIVSTEKVFDDADVHTAIYLFQKNTNGVHDNLVETTTHFEKTISGNHHYNHLSQKYFSSVANNIWNLLINNNNISVIQKITKYDKLSEFCAINRGLITGDKHMYFSKTKDTEMHIKILSGSDILRYSHNLPTEYVLFKRPSTSGGCWDKDVHLSPFKICIRQIGTRPIATLIEDPFAVTGNIFTVINPDKNFLKYLLAIINSKLIKYFWQIMFSDFKSTFPQVTIFSLSQIPINIVSHNITDELVNSVSSILNSKKQDSYVDTSSLESKIDQLVYQLYRLTEEEIKIVENS